MVIIISFIKEKIKSFEKIFFKTVFPPNFSSFSVNNFNFIHSLLPLYLIAINDNLIITKNIIKNNIGILYKKWGGFLVIITGSITHN